MGYYGIPGTTSGTVAVAVLVVATTTVVEVEFAHTAVAGIANACWIVAKITTWKRTTLEEELYRERRVAERRSASYEDQLICNARDVINLIL